MAGSAIGQIARSNKRALLGLVLGGGLGALGGRRARASALKSIDKYEKDQLALIDKALTEAYTAAPPVAAITEPGHLQAYANTKLLMSNALDHRTSGMREGVAGLPMSRAMQLGGLGGAIGGYFDREAAKKAARRLAILTALSGAVTVGGGATALYAKARRDKRLEQLRGKMPSLSLARK